MLRFLTAGESHGRCLVAILEGLPAGLKISGEEINKELRRRQQGRGRGPRMKIEQDRAQLLSGVRRLKAGEVYTIGSPLAMLIENKDQGLEGLPEVLCPRPGHADLVGVLKYGFAQARNVLERASARETAARTAVGAVCKIFLSQFNIQVISKIVTIGGETSPAKIALKIREAKDKKDTLGGIVEVVARGVPPGLGSYVHYDRRLDARLAWGFVSIPAVKAIEFGLGFRYADKFGSEAHDPIYYSLQQAFFRKTNNAGGIEGGMSNGQPITVRLCIKPIATLGKPLPTVNLKTSQGAKASVERSDVCVVDSAAVVAEAVMAFEVAHAFLEKFSGDNLSDIKDSYSRYIKRIRLPFKSAIP